VQTLGLSYQGCDIGWRLLAVEQKTHIEVAVNNTEAAVCEAAQLVYFDQRRPKLRTEVLGNTCNVFGDLDHH
jgi:hypothetical protein